MFKENLQSTLAWSLFLTAAALTVAKFVFMIPSVSTDQPGAFGFRGGSALFPLAFGVLGLLVTTRQPGNPIGWIFAVSGVLGGLLAFGEDYALYGVTFRPGSLPGVHWVAWVQEWAYLPMLGLTLNIGLLLFPAGRLLSPRWRPALVFATFAVVLATLSLALSPGPMEAVPAMVNPAGIEGLAGFLGIAAKVGLALFLISVALSAGSLIVRYRRAGQEEREQTKWVIAAVCLALVTLPLAASDHYIPETVALLGMLSIPAAIGISILKYRLYDIDIVINKGLVYVPLTAILAGLYGAGTGLFKTLFADAAGIHSDFAVAMTTLAVVALFTPIKDRLQQIVNKRFSVSDSRQYLLRYEQDLRSVVTTFHADMLVRRLLDDAVTGLGAEGGAVHLIDGSGRRVACERGVFASENSFTVPIEHRGRLIGELTLGRRRRVGRYSQQETDLINRCASLTATALALAESSAVNGNKAGVSRNTGSPIASTEQGRSQN